MERVVVNRKWVRASDTIWDPFERVWRPATRTEIGAPPAVGQIVTEERIDLTAPLRALLSHLDTSNHDRAPQHETREWWHYTNSYVQEIKRRLHGLGQEVRICDTNVGVAADLGRRAANGR